MQVTELFLLALWVTDHESLGTHRWRNIIKYQCINVWIIHFFGVNELDYVRKQQYIWVVVSHLTFGMIPSIDYWGYWPTPTDGSRIDVRSHGAMGQIKCQVKRSRTSSNCSTSDRCRHLAVYGLSLSSAAVAQVTHLWLEFASGRSEKDGPVEHILAVDAPQIQPGPSEAQWAHNYRSIVLSVLDSSWCWHTFFCCKRVCTLACVF